VTQPKRTRNMLSAKDVFRLNLWCGRNKDSFAGRSREHIAKQASSDLGIEVTVGNIIGALKVNDIRLGPSKADGSASDRVQVLARELENLFIALGQPVPYNVHAIATRRKPQ